MKFLGVTLASLGLASAAAVSKKVSYDDWKVYRVNVGSNAAKLSDVMSKLQLEAWKGKPATSSIVDVMVPPAQVKDFESSAADIEFKVMHENLGASIADEETFGVYAGKSPINETRLWRWLMPYQPDLHRTLPGSTHTIRSLTIINGSPILQLHTPTMLR